MFKVDEKFLSDQYEPKRVFPGGGMGLTIKDWLGEKISAWLTEESPPGDTPMCDFERITMEVRPCDVLLIEGRSRVSDVIKTVSQSPWSHSVLYIGRLRELEDPTVREHLEWMYDGDYGDQLIIEALLGQGTIISPLEKYRNDNLRICRPNGLSRQDVKEVIAYATKHIGCDYDVRQVLDLARFLFPYSFIPRRWRSTLFQHNAGIPTRTVCSSLIAAAFHHVRFPVLPFVERDDSGDYHIHQRYTRLFSPSDFDYSPYFEIIKYPYLDFGDLPLYRKLPWAEDQESGSESSAQQNPDAPDSSKPDMIPIERTR